MASASSPLHSDPAELPAFEDALFRLASEHFGAKVARGHKSRIHTLAKFLAEGQTGEPSVEKIGLVPTDAMREMADRRKLSVRDYLREIADADRAELRSLSLVGDPPIEGTQLIERISDDHHRTKTSPQLCKKIIEAHQTLKIPSSELAKRFGVCASTIRRILVDAGFSGKKSPGRPSL